jgi:hypothetical protein
MQDPPPPIRIVKKTGKAEYEIEKIVSWRKEDNGKASFEVKWLGYEATANTFEPHTNITRYGGKTMFKEFIASTDDPELSKLIPRALRPKRGPQKA